MAAGHRPQHEGDGAWEKVKKEARRTGGRPVVSVRAAEYVRMSTEHQKYSTENQAEVIRRYAARRGIEIVRTYADEGKSGLTIGGRPALKRLLGDVMSGAVRLGLRQAEDREVKPAAVAEIELVGLIDNRIGIDCGTEVYRGRSNLEDLAGDRSSCCRIDPWRQLLGAMS